MKKLYTEFPVQKGKIKK